MKTRQSQVNSREPLSRTGSQGNSRTSQVEEWRYMNLEAICADHLSEVKWLPRNWEEEGRSLNRTDILGEVNEATLWKYFKTYSCLFNACFLSIIKTWVRLQRNIQLCLERSNYEPYHLLIPKYKFSSSRFFQWQCPRAFLDRNIHWQIVFSKDGHNNYFHLTCSFFKVTLTIFPLSGGVFVLSPWTWVDLLHLQLKMNVPDSRMPERFP